MLKKDRELKMIGPMLCILGSTNLIMKSKLDLRHFLFHRSKSILFTQSVRKSTTNEMRIKYSWVSRNSSSMLFSDIIQSNASHPMKSLPWYWFKTQNNRIHWSIPTPISLVNRIVQYTEIAWLSCRYYHDTYILYSSLIMFAQQFL